MEGLILTCRQLADGLVLAGGLLLLAEFQLAGNLLKRRVQAHGLLPLLVDGLPHGDEGVFRAPESGEVCEACLPLLSEKRLRVCRRVLKAAGHDGTPAAHCKTHEQAHRRHG